MGLSFHWIPARNGHTAEETLNRALRSLRVVGVEKHFCAVGPDPGWAVCLEYLDGEPNSGAAKTSDHRKIDYREILDPATFKVFSTLRNWRKEVAGKEAVPVYAILTNEQLAAVARRGCHSISDLEAVEGIGSGHAQKYGPQLLETLRRIHSIALTTDFTDSTDKQDREPDQT